MSRIITEFSGIAKYYQYRLAYMPRFFEDCARALGLDGSQRMLDVACGTGDVARGFSAYVGSILAFDGSREMLDIARDESADHQNIDFLHATFEDLDLPEDFDLVTFGRVIHWLDRDRTLSTLKQVLKKDGSVIVCGSEFSADGSAWLSAFYDVWSRWRRRKKRGRYDGFDIFHNSEFVFHGQISSGYKKEVTLEYLVNHSISYSILTDSVERNKKQFRQELQIALLPFLLNDRIEASVVTRGNIFKYR